MSPAASLPGSPPTALLGGAREIREADPHPGGPRRNLGLVREVGRDVRVAEDGDDRRVVVPVGVIDDRPIGAECSRDRALGETGKRAPSHRIVRLLNDVLVAHE